MFWDSPKERFCIFETSLFVRDNCIRDVQFCWVLVLTFFFLSQQFCLEKCHFDETEIAEEILPILTILLGRELGRNILKVLELPVMTFSEWKGVLIYFFFSFQSDVSKCSVLWGNKMVELNAWTKKKGNQIFWLIRGRFSTFHFATLLVFWTTWDDLKLLVVVFWYPDSRMCFSVEPMMYEPCLVLWW